MAYLQFHLQNGTHVACRLLILLMAIQSFHGVLFHASLYGRDSAFVVSAFRSNDLVTLFLAVPSFLYILQLSRTSSPPPASTEIILGCVFYCFYNYAYYMLGVSMNAMWGLYALLWTSSLLVLLYGLVQCFLQAGVCSPQPPSISSTKRIVCSVALALAGLMIALTWIGGWVMMLMTGSLPMEMEIFRLIAAMDILLQAPFLLLAAYLLWKGTHEGLLLSIVWSVGDAIYMAVLFFTAPFASAYGVPGAWDTAPVWAILGLLFTSVSVLLTTGRTSAPKEQ